jgi:hypothetical protein
MFLNESGGTMKRKNKIKRNGELKKIIFFLNGRNLPMRKKNKKKNF